MKEYKDDVLSGVKESTVTVDFSKSDEIVTERGKIEGIFGERDGEDMMVDVVKECDDDVVESVEKIELVVNEEGVKGSVEVVKEVVQQNVMITVAIGSGCDDRKSGKWPVIGDSEPLSKDAKVREFVQEMADGDHLMAEKTQKETKVINSSNIAESTAGHEVTEESLVGKAEDGVKNQSLSNEVVNAGTCEDKVHVSNENTENQNGVDQIKNESLKSTIEVTTNDSQKLGNGTQFGDSKRVIELDRGVNEETVERPAESVQEAANVDCVMSEKPGKDEILDSAKVPDSVTKLDEVIIEEHLAGKDETQERVSEDQSSLCPDKPSLSSKIVNTGTCEGAAVDNAENLDQNAEVDPMNKLVNAVHEVADGDQDSLKIQDSSIMASLGLEEDDVVVDDEGLEGKNEAQDRVSVEPSVVNPDNQILSTEVVNVGTGEVDQKVEVHSTNKDECSFATIKPNEVTETEPVNDKMKPGIVNGVVETDLLVQSFKLEPATIGHHSSDGQQHGVLPANSGFSYEDANMERGDDAGMDIDEVLGWKDEIPSDPINLTNIQMKETEASIALQQSLYFHPPEIEGDFSVSDLVWGKVRSHLWWPGQIFDSSDASAKAMKYHKKDCFLVAYFGDHTFGWNENNSMVLKPFRENFSQIVEHIDSEAFNNAVHCALEEVSRRVELGLTCSCIPHDIYDNIKYQIVENSGIKQEASRRHGVDKSASVSSFEPDMLVDYMRLLAKFPYGEGDKMELTMAKAQLSSYGRFKGHRQLAEFQLCGDLLEVEHVVKEETHSEDSSKKRKALDSVFYGPVKRLALQTETVTTNPFFKVGGYIQKVASQQTGPPEQPGNQADMLSQLHLAAQVPMKGIIQNHPDEKPLQEHQNGGAEHQLAAYEQEKQRLKPTRRSNKKRFFSSNHEIEAKEQSELIERRRKNLATEVLMKFTEGIYFPSEIHLNKMFKRFGPLMESETEVDRQSGRARVVFKKCSDAEVAHSSAGKFNIFGSINVNYELNYTPLISYKPLPLPLAQDPAHAC